MCRNLHLVLDPGQWTEPTLATVAGRLDLQVVDAGEPVDGWVPVLSGWRYDADPAGVPARGVWVAAEVMHNPGG